MAVELGSRLSYSGEICTVRFVGEISAWPGEVAIGVEWDNIAKGKHNGSYKGVEYFRTTHDTAGSFLKSTKEHDGTRSFYNALIDTYATTVEEREIKIGKKLVESYGFDKLQRLQSDLGYLRNISLSRKEINRIEDDEKELIKEGLVNLEELDISFNLFDNLDTVLDITSNLDLKSLNLTGNRLAKVSTELASNIKSLNLSLTIVSHELLDNIPVLFPSLEKLYLQDNDYGYFETDLSTLTNLRLLDLSLNLLSTIPRTVSSTNITHLNVSNNNIEITSTSDIYESVEMLDIRRNKIGSWKEVELLDEQFPSVTELRINGNTLFQELTSEEADYNVIARWPTLTVLNGVKITEQERTNAELYFLSKVIEGKVIYDESKLQKLSKKHGRSIDIKKPQDPNINDNIISLKFKDEAKTLDLSILKNIEVIRLRGMLGRILKRSILDFQITYNIGRFKEILTNDLALMSSFNFVNGQVLTIELIESE